MPNRLFLWFYSATYERPMIVGTARRPAGASPG
jgi:hypothetical protein